MIKQLPVDRSLPRKQQVLERVLDDNTRRRPWLIPVTAAASIAVVAGGLVIATSDESDRQAPAPAGRPKSAQNTPGTTKTKPGAATKPAEIRVNAGPLGTSEAAALAKACVNRDGHQGQAGTVTRALKVRDWGNPDKTENSVVVLDRSDGLILGCVGFPTAKSPSGATAQGYEVAPVGGDPDAAGKRKSVLNPTDETHPAAPRDGSSRHYSIDFDNAPDTVMQDAWYKVDGRVAAIRQRYVVKGKPGPWFVADAVDGYVFLRSWDASTALHQGDSVNVETQVLDHDGKLLDAPADQKGGGGLTPSPGTTRVDHGKVGADPTGQIGSLTFPTR